MKNYPEGKELMKSPGQRNAMKKDRQEYQFYCEKTYLCGVCDQEKL